MDISADTALRHAAPPFSRRPDITLPAEDDPAAQDPARPGEGPSETDRPRRRRRGWLLATAAALGLVVGGAGFVLSPYNTFYPVDVGSITETARRAVEATGLIAPAARLAQAPAPVSTPMPARPALPPTKPEAQRSELLGLYRGSTGASPTERRAEGRGENPAAAVNAPGPSGPPGTVEPSRTPSDTPTPTAAGDEGAPPQRPSKEAGTAWRAEVPPPTPAERGSGSPTAASPAMAQVAPAPVPPVAAPPPAPQAVAATAPAPSKGTDEAGPGEAAAGRQAALAAAAPPPLAVIPAPVPPPAPAQDPVATAANLRAAPMASPEQIEVLGLVTQMGVVIRDQREEVRQMREDLAAMRETLETQVSDFNRRLSLAEARGAVSAAMGVAAPRPESPATANGPSPRTAQDSSRPEERRRYRIQAASPGLAMLAEIDRSAEAGASIQIAIGDEIPGYGRVQSIGQEGSTWIVRAERGSIQ